LDDLLQQEDINEITKKIIGCAYQVSNTLGIGFLEKVYENALAHLIRKSGLAAVQQHPIKVTFDGIIVGNFMPTYLSVFICG
jgi:GxxExxY protein